MYREYDSQFQGEIIVTATHSGCDIYDISPHLKRVDSISYKMYKRQNTQSQCVIADTLNF